MLLCVRMCAMEVLCCVGGGGVMSDDRCVVSGHLTGHCHMTQSVRTECSNLSKWHWDKQNVHLNINEEAIS